jgi:hypothetical protein
MKASVVIAGSGDKHLSDRCVSALRRIAAGESLEIIVVPCEPQSIFRCRAEGIERASGDRIAVLSDRYEVTQTWLRALLQESHRAVTGGPVAPSPALNYWGWCVYLCEYAHVAPPVMKGATRRSKLVPGGNVVYSQTVVRQFPPAQANSDLRYHSDLIGAVSVGICPDLEVRFAWPPRFWEYVHERFCFSHAIGAAGGIKKAPIALLLPLIVPLRICAAVAGKRRYWMRFALCLPVILPLSILQAAGEFAGALSAFGKPDGRQ